MELLGYALEPLCEDEEFILYRGHSKQAEAPSVLLLAPVSSRPALGTLKKIEHEYSLRNELDAAWAVRPLTYPSTKSSGYLCSRIRGVSLSIGSFTGRWK